MLDQAKNIALQRKGLIFFVGFYNGQCTHYACVSAYVTTSSTSVKCIYRGGNLCEIFGKFWKKKELEFLGMSGKNGNGNIGISWKKKNLGILGMEMGLEMEQIS